MIILLMIVVVIALMLAACATVCAFIACFVVDQSTYRLLAAGGAALAGGATVALIRCMVVLNNRWKQQFISKFNSAPEQLLARWTVTPQQWNALAEFEKNESQRDAPYVAAWAGTIFGAVATYAFWTVLGGGALIVGGFVALAAAALGWILEHRAGNRPYFHKMANQKVTIALRDDGMVVGELPIAWGGMYGSLSAFACSSPDTLDFSVLTVEVRRRTGEGSAYHTYRVPLPYGQRDLPLASGEKAKQLAAMA